MIPIPAVLKTKPETKGPGTGDPAGEANVATGLLAFLPADPTLRHNARQNLVDGAFFSAMLGFFNPFMSVFAMALGATNYMVGLLVSLPAAAGMVGQALGALLSNGARRKLPIVIEWALVSRLFFLLFAALPYLPVPKAWVFVAAVGLMNLPTSVANLAWTALVQRLFPPQYRGQIFGLRYTFNSAATLAATAVGGYVLSVLRFPTNYTVLNLASFAALLLSLLYLTKLREPTEAQPAQAQAADAQPVAARRKAGSEVLAAVGRARRNKQFTTFMVAIGAFWFGLFMPQALYPILFVREMNMPTTWIGLLYTAGGLSAMLTYRFWGRFADRHGHRLTLAICVTARPIHSLLYCFAHAAWTPSIIEFAFCGFVSGFDLCAFNAILESAPQEDSPTYIAVFNIVNGLLVLIAPMLGVWVASMTGVRAGIAISSAARLVGVVMLWRVARAGMPKPAGAAGSAAARVTA